jgi:hypothetical protein
MVRGSKNLYSHKEHREGKRNTFKIVPSVVNLKPNCGAGKRKPIDYVKNQRPDPI